MRLSSMTSPGACWTIAAVVAAWAGLAAGISAAVLPTIAYDIPWNAGIFKSLTIECPEGLEQPANRRHLT